MRGRTLRFEQRDKENDNDIGERIIVPYKRNGMVAFSFFFVFCSLFLFVQPSSSSTPQQQPSNFTDIDLIGDAHFVDDSHVRLTRPAHFSSGVLRRLEPLTFSVPASALSTEFSFSVSGAGDGFLFVLTPAADVAALSGNVSDYVGVEFDTSKDKDVGDINAIHVGVDVGSHVSVSVANVSDVNLVLNSGKKLNAWVDYEGKTKTLEVRLSKFGEEKPNSPIVSHSIDFLKMWDGNPVFAGLGSSNGENSAQVVGVYSWKFDLKEGSKGLDSVPAGAQGLSEEQHMKLCPLTILAGVIFGTGCVALVTFVGLFTWVLFFTSSEEESLVKIPDNPSEVRYERIDVAVDKNSQDDESLESSS